MMIFRTFSRHRSAAAAAKFSASSSQKEEQNPRSASEEECVQDFRLARKKSTKLESENIFLTCVRWKLVKLAKCWWDLSEVPPTKTDLSK